MIEIDINYDNYTAEYSKDKVIDNMELTLEEGLLNFIKKVEAHG